MPFSDTAMNINDTGEGSFNTTVQPVSGSSIQQPGFTHAPPNSTVTKGLGLDPLIFAKFSAL